MQLENFAKLFTKHHTFLNIRKHSLQIINSRIPDVPSSSSTTVVVLPTPTRRFQDEFVKVLFPPILPRRRLSTGPSVTYRTLLAAAAAAFTTVTQPPLVMTMSR
uniref:Ovule protein n=1 Tax=Steinernema glaseri TaxID=37863 RepID=A0A1I8ABG1_9BILA